MINTLKCIGAARPALTIDTLVWAVALYAALAFNQAFWRACAKAGLFEASLGWLTSLCLFAIIAAANVLVLRLLCTRRSTKAVLVAFLTVAGVIAFFSGSYGTYFDVGMMRNMLQTDASEASQLLTPRLVVHTLLYSGIPALVIVWIRIVPVSLGRTMIRMMTTIGLALLLIVVSGLISFKDASALMRNHREIRHLIAPTNALVSLGRIVVRSMRGSARRTRRTIGADARLDAHVNVQKHHVLVIVVGETVRSANWGLNGYHRQTTPQLTGIDLINYPDVSACGSSTEVSLPCMFSAHGRGSYDADDIRNSESLLHVMQRAGAQTLWRDNQGGCKGVCADLPFESLRDADDPRFCSEAGCQDGVLLSGLRERIERSTTDQVIVLHQLGNHGPAYYLRYPDRLRTFRPDCRHPDLGECSQAEIVNAYDNAILATDDMVAQTIRMLEAISSRDSAVIYVSDHGESLGEKNLYLHGLPYAIAPDTQLKVPMVAWISPGLAQWRGLDVQCLKQNASQPVSHDNLFHSALGLMQVSTTAYRPALDLFRPCMRGAMAAGNRGTQ